MNGTKDLERTQKCLQREMERIALRVTWGDSRRVLGTQCRSTILLRRYRMRNEPVRVISTRGTKSKWTNRLQSGNLERVREIRADRD